VSDQVEAALLNLCKDVRRVLWPEGVKDPGDMGRDVLNIETVDVLSERLQEVLSRLD
jgi:hypothetical protein